LILSFLQYVDPGTGSLLTQLILSVVIGAGFYLVVLRKRVAAALRRFWKSRSEASPVGEKAKPDDCR
jgi:hypothetical protein